MSLEILLNTYGHHHPDYLSDAVDTITKRHSVAERKAHVSGAVNRPPNAARRSPRPASPDGGATGAAAELGLKTYQYMLRHACGFALANMAMRYAPCKPTSGTRTFSTQRVIPN
jgi:hypothetical protein